MTPHDYSIFIILFVIAMWIYIIANINTRRQEALREIMRGVSMKDEYRMLDPYKGPTCILSHKACKDMDCRRCVFALAEILKEKR